MKNISIILKNNILITVEEFKALNRYSDSGKMVVLIERLEYQFHLISKQRVVEYIFEPEAFTMFSIISQNILVSWDTELTKNLSNTQEVQIADNFFIQKYPYMDS